MGKYTKKPKIAGDVAVMEVSPQSSLGVRTRAKTLALQRLQKSQSPSLSSLEPDASSFSYLQLRSRRLEKVLFDTKKQQQSSEQPKRGLRDGPNGYFCSVNSRVKAGLEESLLKKEEGSFEEIAREIHAEQNFDLGIKTSYGEKMLQFEGRDRSTKENTPCSSLRDSDTIGSPGSSTRQRPMTNHINYEDVHRIIPTAYEMEEFFAYAEKQQQRIFMEKYNFDIVNDVPLPGRYQWVQVLHCAKHPASLTIDQMISC